MESTPLPDFVGKADAYTVEVVTPIVEGDPRVPLSDRRRFCDWVDGHHSVRTLIPMIRGNERTDTILALLAEEYAWYLESESELYCMDLLLRAEDTEGGIRIAEPLTPDQRMARAKERVREYAREKGE